MPTEVHVEPDGQAARERRPLLPRSTDYIKLKKRLKAAVLLERQPRVTSS